MAPKVSYVAKHAGGYLFNVLKRTSYGVERSYLQEEEIMFKGLPESTARECAARLMREGVKPHCVHQLTAKGPKCGPSCGWPTKAPRVSTAEQKTLAAIEGVKRQLEASGTSGAQAVLADLLDTLNVCESDGLTREARRDLIMAEMDEIRTWAGVVRDRMRELQTLAEDIGEAV